ncbi:MAG: DUF934 domain-containing protein [Myxococcales bacterium]|nr:DUF934 domain-containing protein [Myxococcales bacterium]
MKRLTREGAVETTPLSTVDVATFQAQLVDGVSPEVGVELQPTDDVETLAEILKRAPVIRLIFPKFREGRPYSQARLLRARIGYQGRIVAAGPLFPDQAQFLWRTGFSAVEIEDESRLDTWVAASKRFDSYHQITVGDRSQTNA